MFELVGKGFCQKAAARVFTHYVERNLFPTHDPEHIESPEGVKGIESLCGGVERLCGNAGRLCGGVGHWLYRCIGCHMEYEYSKINVPWGYM